MTEKTKFELKTYMRMHGKQAEIDTALLNAIRENLTEILKLPTNQIYQTNFFHKTSYNKLKRVEKLINNEIATHKKKIYLGSSNKKEILIKVQNI